MARRTRIIYASQSVHAEGRILYRIQTLGSSTTFNTTDYFQLGQLNLTDVVDDNPEVAVTLEGLDYGSVYTMATLAKIPTDNLNHNIRQADGVTFFGTVSGSDTSTGDVSALLPAASGTGIANIVAKDGIGGAALKYLHGVQLIDFGRECGTPKGCDIWSPVQAECSLGTADDQIEMTKLLKDVFINSIEMNYQSNDASRENYNGETEKKQWFLNDARFLSWEEWQVGNQSNQLGASALGAKTELKLSLPAGALVATLEDKNLGFLKKDLTGKPAVLFIFAAADGLAQAESKAVPVFDKAKCIPTNAVEYFLYDSSDNTLEYNENGASSTLANVLPAGRSAFAIGDKAFVFYAANAYAAEIGAPTRPVGADSSFVAAKYFAPISTSDVEDIGAVRQGQIEAYLVDPDLLFKKELTGATIGVDSIEFSGNVPSQIDLGKFVGLSLKVVDGPGKNGPAREVVAATNDISGSFNDGSLSLAGADWAKLVLKEDPSQSSTRSGVFVSELCGIDSAYVGSQIVVVASGASATGTITAVNSNTNLVSFTPAAPVVVDDGSVVLVSTRPTTASTILVGDYQMALRLENVDVRATLTRTPLKQLGNLNPYARPLTLPIAFTATVNTTAADLENFAVFAGKSGKFKDGTLTDIDIIDLLSKKNLAIVVAVYQQTDSEAGGTGADRKVLTDDMFGDEYFVDGTRQVYAATDGSLREYPLKTVVIQNLRVTNEAFDLRQGQNATQTFGFRGTNEVTVIRGYVNADLVTKVFESQSK